MFTPKTFCPMPWSSVQIAPSGEYRICCFNGAKFELNEDGHPKMLDNPNLSETYNVLTHSVKDAMNDHIHKSIRLSQSKNEQHISCWTCWHLENAQTKMNQDNLESLRYARTKQFENEDVIKFDNASENMNDDGSITSIIRHLDFRFDNLCNMKCVMCDPMNSSLWYDDHIELTGQNFFYDGMKKFNLKKINGITKSDYPDWKNSPIFWQRMEEMKGTLNSIYLNGGEPFVSPFLPKFLNYFIEAGVAKNIRIDTDTNLSILNDKYLDILKQFKYVRFSVSCDDTEERYNLIRFPGNYKIFKKNFELLKSTRLDSNINFNKMTSCIGIHNIFAPIRLYQEFHEDVERFSLRLLRRPIEYDIMFLNKNMKLEILEKYEKSNIPLKHKTVVMGYLQNNLDTEDINNVRKYVERMDKLDKIRNTNWRTVFSDSTTLLRKFYPELNI
mgnify:FL=1